MVIPILLEKCFANKIYFAILKRCIDCFIILFKHFLSNVQGVPCITFLKAMFLHILPSNWHLATFMLLQVDIAKIFSMLQYYMLEINFSFMNVPQLYSYSGLRILQQFSIANFICKILPSTEHTFVFEINLFSQL